MKKVTLSKWLDDHEKKIKTGKKKYKDSMFHQIAYADLSACMKDIRTAVDNADIESAVLCTAKFVKKYHGYTIRLGVPEIRGIVRKESSEIAHKGKAWKPAQLKALKREYLKKIQTLPHWTACKELAKAIYKKELAKEINKIDDKKEKKKIVTKYSRRINTQIAKMNLSE